MMDFKHINEIIKNEAEALGIKEYEIYASEGADISVSTLNAEVNAFSSGTTSGVCLRVCEDGKMGYASSELVTDDEMVALVSRAISNARATEKLGGVGIYSGSDSYDELPDSGYVKKDTKYLRQYAKETADAIYQRSDKVQNGTETTALSNYYSIKIANSHGLNLECSGGIDALVAAAVVAEGDVFESAYEVTLLDDNTDITSVADKAVSTAERKIGAGAVTSGKYDIVFSAKQMRTILSAFVPVFSAKMAQMGMSLLAGKEGEKIASDIVTITDDPMREGVPVKTNFDAEGVAAHRKFVIESGVLKTLLHNRETAKKQGVESTGNASKGSYNSPVAISPYAFCLEAGEISHDAILELAGNGLYITELKGLHAGADAVTGDFSLESAGFRIVDGKLGEAVKTFTIAGNFFELLKSIEALSDKVEVSITGGFTTYGAPDVLVRGMSVAGK